MISYLLKSGLLLLIFYAVYKLWLENEKMLHFNRAYLLGSLVISFIVPLQLFTLNPLFQNAISFVQLEEIIITTAQKDNSQTISAKQYAFILAGIFYVLIVVLLMIRFIKNLYSFYNKVKKNEFTFIQGAKIIVLDEPVLPHSFWKTIFINKKEFVEGQIPLELIAHEKAHLSQKHTLDILLLEILQIFFWFNPMLILFKKAIKLNHEFLADEAVNQQFKSVREYQNLLLNIASDKNTVALASNINYVITKKRLLMMTRKKSPIRSTFKIGSTSIVAVMLLIVFSTKSVAQNIISNSEVIENQLYMLNDVEKSPEFQGGMAEFYKFMGSNFKIPTEASKNKFQGKALMQFVIEKDGSLSEIGMLQDPGYGIGDEAIRVLKRCPKWIAATHEGKPVRVMYSLPITIQANR